MPFGMMGLEGGELSGVGGFRILLQDDSQPITDSDGTITLPDHSCKFIRFDFETHIASEGTALSATHGVAGGHFVSHKDGKGAWNRIDTQRNGFEESAHTEDNTDNKFRVGGIFSSVAKYYINYNPVTGVISLERKSGSAGYDPVIESAFVTGYEQEI